MIFTLNGHKKIKNTTYAILSEYIPVMRDYKKKHQKKIAGK
jgi:hypothetical protein